MTRIYRIAAHSNRASLIIGYGADDRDNFIKCGCPVCGYEIRVYLQIKQWRTLAAVLADDTARYTFRCGMPDMGGFLDARPANLADDPQHAVAHITVSPKPFARHEGALSGYINREQVSSIVGYVKWLEKHTTHL